MLIATCLLHFHCQTVWRFRVIDSAYTLFEQDTPFRIFIKMDHPASSIDKELTNQDEYWLSGSIILEILDQIAL